MRGATLITQSKFPLGRLVATTNLISTVPPDEVYSALQRHANGDWGEVCEEDRESNEVALIHDSRLMLEYSSSLGTTF
ncbi:hypothetical protein CCB80_02155 [Armatimonadetes bacterium Uphvl-Ar1]|nr:hypothetical protein CCB80_02155 [Armatimonadetes bacterium Uphvl-Ar1]